MNDIYPAVANNGFCAVNNSEVQPETGTVMPQRWMLDQQGAPKANRMPVTANQLTSLSAMIAYMAHKSGQSEFRIERRLADQFRVANAKCLAAEDFDNAIRYLADILPA